MSSETKSKNCEICGQLFFKSATKSMRAWLTRTRVCSVACRNTLVSQIGKGNPQRFTKERFADKTKHPRWKGGISKQSGYHTLYARRYQNRKNKAAGSFTYEEWLFTKSLYDNRCVSCFRQEPVVRLAADHVKPLAKGGDSFISNIQPLCRQCNGYKCANEVDFRPDFIRSQFALI